MLEYGVDKADIFQTNDLFERKDLGAVTNTIFALDRAVAYQTNRYAKKTETGLFGWIEGQQKADKHTNCQTNKKQIIVLQICFQVGRHPEWTGARLQGQAGAQQSVYFNQN